jgi:hypothetical protein
LDDILVVYTALFGDYDNLIEPKENYENCYFVCFTDQKHLKSNIWDIKIIEHNDLPLNVMNRKYKMLPHLFFNEYKWSLYIDSNIAIVGNIYNLAKRYLDTNDIAIPIHFKRECIYEELLAVEHSKKANSAIVNNFKSYLQKEGFPENFGLTENNIIFRRHNSTIIIKLMDEWWIFFNEYIQRDQLHLMFLIWKYNINLNKISINSRGNDFFRTKPHKSENIKCIFSNLYINILEIIYNNPKLLKLQSILIIYKKFCEKIK